MSDDVLIIDDDEILTAILAEYLRDHSLEVEHAAHSTRGLSLLKTQGTRNRARRGEESPRQRVPAVCQHVPTCG